MNTRWNEGATFRSIFFKNFSNNVISEGYILAFFTIYTNKLEVWGILWKPNRRFIVLSQEKNEIVPIVRYFVASKGFFVTWGSLVIQ